MLDLCRPAYLQTRRLIAIPASPGHLVCSPVAPSASRREG
jgi:hypothetical protein